MIGYQKNVLIVILIEFENLSDLNHKVINFRKLLNKKLSIHHLHQSNSNDDIKIPEDIDLKIKNLCFQGCVSFIFLLLIFFFLFLLEFPFKLINFRNPNEEQIQTNYIINRI